MTEDEFVGLVGPVLEHVTAVANLPSIRAAGLMRPARLAALAGVDPAGLALRTEALVLTLPWGTATLNHQLPLRAGRRADFIDGLTIEDWSAQLDGRVFLWPGRARASFAGSVAARGATATLAVDARALFRGFASFLDLAAINTGSATRRPARRGPWTYVPATASVAAFREARRARGLKAGLDAVAEVSLRCDLTPEALARLMPAMATVAA